jgi:hypothetical protein
MLYLLKRSRRRKLNSKISFLLKNPVFKAKPSRRPQSLCVKLTKLPPYDEITRFDGDELEGGLHPGYLVYGTYGTYVVGIA